MKSRQREHIFRKGQRVNVQLKDWTPLRPTCAKACEAVILELVERPFGYDIKLDEPITFRGNTPFPLIAQGDAKFDDLTDGVQMTVLFVKEFMLSKVYNRLRDVLTNKFSTLEFRVISAVHTKPPAQIEYINYHRKDGTIETLSDDRQLFEQAETETDKRELRRRLAYRLTHFYGFTKPNSPAIEERKCDKTLHYTMNRFSDISFYNGFEWVNIEDSIARKPEVGQLICGEASQHKADKAPSFDNWFICSNQFMRLVTLIRNRETPRIMAGMTEDEIIESLIIPPNTGNYYIAHEKPLSRFLYAAIYLLAIKSQDRLPADWQLPEKKGPGGDVQPFEVWWPNAIMMQNN